MVAVVEAGVVVADVVELAGVVAGVELAGVVDVAAVVAGAVDAGAAVVGEPEVGDDGAELSVPLQPATSNEAHTTNPSAFVLMVASCASDGPTTSAEGRNRAQQLPFRREPHGSSSATSHDG